MNLTRSRSISLIFPARANLATAVDLAPKTRERYVELAENQIIPHLGDIKLAKLKPEHLAEWHAVLLKTLSRRTVLHAHRCLSRVLADAVALGTLGRNVAAVRRPPAVEDDELVILTEEQVQAVLTSLMGEITASIPSSRWRLRPACAAASCLHWNGATSISMPARSASSAALRRRKPACA